MRVVDSLQSGPSTVAAILLFPLGPSAFSLSFFLSLSYTFFLYGVGFLECFSFGFSFGLLLLQSNLEEGKMSKLIWRKRES